MEVGRARGSEWFDWAIDVRDALGQCRAQERAVVPALFACFEEVSEHAMTVVCAFRSVHSDLTPISQTTTSNRGGEKS
jgi:hypothetical protein